MAERPREPAKPGWQRFLESSGGAALITVVLGGILGQWINWSIQKGIKDREFQQAWMKARGDQALASYNQYLTQENEIVQRIYDLVGSCLSASADLIILTTPEFAPGSHVGIEEQRAEIRIGYNKTDTRWRSEKAKLGLLMGYYHRGQSEVIKAWEGVEEALTTYMDSARRWYFDHVGSPGNAATACKSELNVLKDRLAELRRNLEASRRYAWEGWESPSRLREVLEREERSR